MARLARSGALVGSLLASLVVFIAGAAVGYCSISSEWAAASASGGGSGSAFSGSLVTIFVRNLSAIMLLYSGVVTLGVSSLLGVGLLSAYVGATMSVSVSNAGVWSLIGHTGWYAPLEFLGCVVAGAAGLYPVFVLAGRIFAGGGQLAALGTYLNAVGASLKIFLVAVGVIGVAAVIETIVIATR